MKTLLIAAIAAACLMPVVAQAHTSPRELRHDRRAVVDERFELRRALRHGSHARIHKERGEYRAAVRELHEDRRDWHRHHRCGPRGLHCWR
ncbi:MAG: hypothetical protein RL367_1528 [Pseudomonadota bacterium]|jgi:hypothetical protein